jgi:hypothetical protein
MTAFRGTDEALEREIVAVETLVRVRLRRANEGLRELEAALDELRRERRRRQLLATVTPLTQAAETASA